MTGLIDERGTDRAPRPIRRASNLRTAPAPQVARPRLSHLGITRRTNVSYDRTTLPLTDLQSRAFSAVTDAPQAASHIARSTGLTKDQAGSALRYLAAKNLVVKTPTGWKRTA